MSLIDTTYFKGDLDIAGLSSTHVIARVQAFIDKYEPKFLRLLWGEGLYADYVAGIAVDPVDTIWTVLQSEDLKRAIACYVYYWYMRDRETITTSTGEAKPETENSTQASSLYKQVRAWNEMVELVQGIYDYLDANALVYPSWVSTYRWYSYSRYHYGRIPNHFKPINALNL